MTLFFYYGSGDLGDEAVRLGSQGFTFSEAAESGTLAMNRVRIDDPTGTLTITGHHAFNVRETACSFPWLFRGYFGDRTYMRAPGLETGAARIIDGTVYDLNSALQFEVFRGSTAQRPAETDTERLAWALGSAFLGPISSDGSMVIGADVDLDKQDYRGQTLADVLSDCATVSGNNYFVAYDDTLGVPVLHYYAPTQATFTSSVKISNVLADVDMATVYAPDKSAKLNKDPSRVYSGVYYQYGDSDFAAVYETSGAVQSAIGHKRETTEQDPSIKTATKASAKANRYLTESATELDTIDVTLVKVRPADVNLIRAGHRIQVKFTHLPGYSSYTYMRVIRRAVRQADESQLFYELDLTLANPKQMGGRVRHAPAPSPDASGPSASGSPITLVGRECHNYWDSFDADTAPDIGYGNPVIKRIGSWIYHNVAYTLCGCPLGFGGWSGLATFEGWWEFTTPTLSADDVGVRFTISAANPTYAFGLYDQRYSYGFLDHEPDDVGQGNILGYFEWTADGAVVDLPRSALVEGGTSYFFIAPAWVSQQLGFYCAQDLVDGLNGPAGSLASGGEGNSGNVRQPTVTATLLSWSGTSGWTPWTPGDGAVDGDNDTWELYGWTGIGVPQVKVNGLVLDGSDYDYDDVALTVTLRAPPEEGDVVTFRYQLGA